MWSSWGFGDAGDWISRRSTCMHMLSDEDAGDWISSRSTCMHMWSDEDAGDWISSRSTCMHMWSDEDAGDWIIRRSTMYTFACMHMYTLCAQSSFTVHERIKSRKGKRG